MSYLPHTDSDIREMLKVIGVKQIDDLFPDVPQEYRFPEMDLPEALTQMEVAWRMEEMSNANLPGGKTAIFLGAGAYNHWSPPVVNHTLLRGTQPRAITSLR
jgi:glycine dehydrogenase subunit 1